MNYGRRGGGAPVYTPSTRRRRDGGRNSNLVIITYLWSCYPVKLDIARPADFGHVQVAAEVEERI